MSLNLHIKTFIYNFKRWRFPVELLQDAQFIKFAEERINNYFEVSLDETDAHVNVRHSKHISEGKLLVIRNPKPNNNVWKWKQLKIKLDC